MCFCSVCVCCGDHLCEFAMVVPSVDASAGELVSVLCLCVCVCVCFPMWMPVRKRPWFLCVSVVLVCAVGPHL